MLFLSLALLASCMATTHADTAYLRGDDGNLEMTVGGGRAFSITCPPVTAGQEPCFGPNVVFSGGVCVPKSETEGTTAAPSGPTLESLDVAVTNLETEQGKLISQATARDATIGSQGTLLTEMATTLDKHAANISALQALINTVDTNSQTRDTGLGAAVAGLSTDSGVAIVDTQDAVCDTEGMVRYNKNNKQLQVCNGAKFVAYSSPAGSAGASDEVQAVDCSDLKAKLPDAGSGIYTIGKHSEATAIYCDMTTGQSKGGNGKSPQGASPSCAELNQYFGIPSSGEFYIGANSHSAAKRYCIKSSTTGAVSDAGGDGSSPEASAASCSDIYTYWGAGGGDMSGPYYINSKLTWCQQAKNDLIPMGGDGSSVEASSPSCHFLKVNWGQVANKDICLDDDATLAVQNTKLSIGVSTCAAAKAKCANDHFADLISQLCPFTCGKCPFGSGLFYVDEHSGMTYCNMETEVASSYGGEGTSSDNAALSCASVALHAMERGDPVVSGKFQVGVEVDPRGVKIPGTDHTTYCRKDANPDLLCGDATECLEDVGGDGLTKETAAADCLHIKTHFDTDSLKPRYLKGSSVTAPYYCDLVNGVLAAPCWRGNTGTSTLAGSRNGDTIYCNQDLEGGKWELLLNLNTKDSNMFWWDSSHWKSGLTYNEGNVASPFGADYKGPGFMSRTDFSEIMLVAHASGTYRGHSVYKRIARDGDSFHDIFDSNAEVTMTGARTSSGGQVKNVLTRNTDRPQSLFGDIFIDFNEPLVFNKQSGWGSCRSNMRIATTLTNNDYAHTFAGIGGRHEQGCGSYVTNFEFAPITAYCAAVRGYGGSSGTSGGALASSCLGAWQWVDVSMSIYVR
eukprot:m.481439 g.481439  ORF g.481439 m.481439 type:complete len:851 (+) comp22172_c0_seq1:154-2706(+)